MRGKWVLAAGLLMLIVAAMVYLGHDERTEPDRSVLVAHSNVLVAKNQVIHKLLTIGGNATVEGGVDVWTAVVDGGLQVAPGGSVSGALLVVNGDLSVDSAADFRPAIQIYLPKRSILLSVSAWATAAALVLGLPGIAFLAWLVRRLVLVTIRRLPVGWGDIGQRWPAFLAGFGLLVSGILLASFVHLAAETIYFHEAELVDSVVIWLVHYLARPGLDRWLTWITYAGSGYVYGLLAPGALAVLYYWRRWRDAVVLITCLLGASALNYLLKHLFERARPDFFRVIAESGYSFPSGHAMVSLCFYGFVVYLIGRRMHHTLARRTLYALTAGFVGLIGFSRIYLGVHYPSDVVGGYIAGGTWLTFCITLLWWWDIKQEGR